METTIKWIAVDWGTTRLRVWLMDGNDAAFLRLESARGMNTLMKNDFEEALVSMVENYLPTDRVVPVMCCGMVGGRQGWRETSYVSVPATPPGVQYAKTFMTQDSRLRIYILPGMCQYDPVDVMRGEETQIKGFLEHQPDFEGTICLPGTHAKWVKISKGNIVQFTTFMTSELFALLSQHSVLKHSVSANGWSEDAFVDAMLKSMEEPEKSAEQLFRLRATSILLDQSPDVARARLSGYLIGTELSAARPYYKDQTSVLIGSRELIRIYQQALSRLNQKVSVYSGDDLVLSGLKSAMREA